MSMGCMARMMLDCRSLGSDASGLCQALLRMNKKQRPLRGQRGLRCPTRIDARKPRGGRPRRREARIIGLNIFKWKATMLVMPATKGEGSPRADEFVERTKRRKG